MEAIITADEEESEGSFEPEDDHDNDDHHDDDFNDGIEDDPGTVYSHRGNVKKTSPTFDRRREKNVGRRGRQRQSMSAVTVHLCHEPSKVLFVWRTAGVKDTSGAELHEGEAYRLVATVQSIADAAAGKVGVTRCRLTPITDSRSKQSR